MIKVNKTTVELDGVKPVLVAESICVVLSVLRKLEDYQKIAYLQTLSDALNEELNHD